MSFSTSIFLGNQTRIRVFPILKTSSNIFFCAFLVRREDFQWQQLHTHHCHRFTDCIKIILKNLNQLQNLLLLLKVLMCGMVEVTLLMMLPSLEEQGVRQLYPTEQNVDLKKELRSLNRELQLHILELADVLVERRSQYARRVEDISLIFKNLHHLLNPLRPYQARATLIHILELPIQRGKQAVDDIKMRREEAQKLSKEALGTLNGE